MRSTPGVDQRRVDEAWMGRALELARASGGLASPNPQVGCVLVRPAGLVGGGHGTVLGEGAHLYDGRDHAEIVALKRAAAGDEDVRGATAYVTLEPCAHHGRTGPCAEALAAAGMARCVVATVDPNPVVRGKGLAILEAAGIAVELGVCEGEARLLIEDFAFAIQHGRPMVTLKAAISADGFLAPAASLRQGRAPFWVTGPEARAEVQRLRHAADALVTGIGTVLADDPALTDRSGLRRRRPLLRVVLDPQLRLPETSRLLTEVAGDEAGRPDLLLLCGVDASPAREEVLRRAARGQIEILRLRADEAGRLRPADVLGVLQERQCRGVLLEAGAGLNGAFLRAGLVDRVVLYQGPARFGEGSVPFAAGGPTAAEVRARLADVREERIGADTVTTGLLHDPWRGSGASAEAVTRG